MTSFEERVAALIVEKVQQTTTALREAEAPTHESVAGAIRESTTAVERNTAVQQEILSEVRGMRARL